MQRWGFVYLPSLLYHPVLFSLFIVCHPNIFFYIFNDFVFLFLDVNLSYSWEGTKPGLWNLDWTMTGLWTGLWTRFWTGQQNLQTNVTFPGLTAVQYLIASSLVSKVRIIQIPMHFFGLDVSI